MAMHILLLYSISSRDCIVSIDLVDVVANTCTSLDLTPTCTTALGYALDFPLNGSDCSVAQWCTCLGDINHRQFVTRVYSETVCSIPIYLKCVIRKEECLI